MNAHAHHHLEDAAVKRCDPTGTMPLRDAFRRDLDRRWDALRRLAREAVIKSDIFGLGGPTVETIAHSSRQAASQHHVIPGADQVKGFQSWLDEALRVTVLAGDGAWTRPYIERACAMGKARAEKLTGRTALVRDSRVRDLASLTVVELQGVIEAVSQQAVRAAAHDLIAGVRPARIARDVAARIDKIGRTRGRSLAAYMVVKAFNSATLDAFRSLGIKKVGTVPERLRIRQTAHGKTLDALFDEQARVPAGQPGGGEFAGSGGGEKIGNLEKHGAMREYTAKELDWEYNREYLVYSKPIFPEAFKSREDFQKQYEAAPIVHLSEQQLRALGNSMAAGGLGKNEAWVHQTFGHRRDSKAIIKELKSGKTAPPIVLQHGDKMRLMAGQTRLAAGMALGKSVPVKLIKVRGKTDDAAMIADAARKTKQKRHGKSGRFVPYTPMPSKKEYDLIMKREARLARLENVDVITAGDDHVCQACEDISDEGPYTIDEAESLIPAHPDCRCAFVPADDDRYAEDGYVEDDFDPALHPHGQHGQFSETGGQQKEEPQGLKHFKASANGNEHVKQVASMLEKPALANHTYRWRVGKLVEETKQYQTKFAPDLKLKIAQSFGLERQKYLAKGDQATADKLYGKMVKLGWKDDGTNKPAEVAPKLETPKAPTNKDAETGYQKVQSAVLAGKSGAEAVKTMTHEELQAVSKEHGSVNALHEKLKEIDQGKAKPAAAGAKEMLTGHKLVEAKFKENTGGKKLAPLEGGKEKIKAAVQTGADAPTAKWIMTAEEQAAVEKQYGSVEIAHGKAQGYYQQEMKQKEASAKAEASQKAAALKEKAEADKIANDPETKAHYEVLAGITGGSAKEYINAAASKVKYAGLSGKISPPEAAHIIAYSGSHYRPVNAQLREGVMTEQQWGFAKALNNALDKLPAYDGVTYRKATIEEQFAKNYKAGMIVEERGFTSSSKNSSVWSGSLQFEIHGKNGRDISKLSSSPGESEVLFKSGSRFRVTSRAGNKIVMKEVD